MGTRRDLAVSSWALRLRGGRAPGLGSPFQPDDIPGSMAENPGIMSGREVKQITVGRDEDGVRLDRWLRRRWPTLGQAQIHKLARTGQLRVGGARVKAETRLAAGDLVRVPPLDAPAPRVAGDALTEEEIAFARGLVLHEDA